jgi:hypothetical protein
VGWRSSGRTMPGRWTSPLIRFAAQARWSQGLAGQRFCRAAVAVGQIRGNLLARLRQCQRRLALLWLVISSSTIRSSRIQVLTRGRQSTFTTIICRKRRRHELRRHCRASLRSGYALPV